MTYKQRNVESKKFVTIGERIHCISPVIREAMATFNPDPILERAAQQIKPAPPIWTSTSALPSPTAPSS